MSLSLYTSMPHTLSNFRLHSAITELKVLHLAENVERIREKIFLSGPKTEKKIKKAKFLKIVCFYCKHMEKNKCMVTTFMKLFMMTRDDNEQ